MTHYQRGMTYLFAKLTYCIAQIWELCGTDSWIFCTLGVLPKIPFKLTQSIHVAIQTSCNFDWNLLIFFFTLNPIKGKLGFILEITKKIASWRHKLEISKRNIKIMISPLLFHLWGWLGCQKKQYDPLKFI